VGAAERAAGSRHPPTRGVVTPQGLSATARPRRTQSAS
jgi:hypothetical protein